MKKLSISLLLLLSLAGCSNVTGLTVQKHDVHALIEQDGYNKCIVQFEDLQKPIKTNFTCDQVKYFGKE